LEGYQKRIDNLIAMATYAEEIVNLNEHLELLVKRQSFSVCFRYIPKHKINLNTFNLELREAMRKNGKSIVNYGYIGEKLVIRLVTTNGETNKKDINLFFNNLLKTASKLESKNNVIDI
jgi:sulfinoalanine decarboxylase